MIHDETQFSNNKNTFFVTISQIHGKKRIEFSRHLFWVLTLTDKVFCRGGRCSPLPPLPPEPPWEIINYFPLASPAGGKSLLKSLLKSLRFSVGGRCPPNPPFRRPPGFLTVFYGVN